ncbi:YceI family protein [Melioribacteraceae bacterium 4301-Me]|uniref:YceI family protein n=1 Tax=Pyranulibacter aquaticus TaxID=3163344 RepID=UPI0035978E61
MDILGLSLITLGLVAGSTQVETTWEFDKAHSKVGFSVRHMVISEVEGYFKEFNGSVVTKGDDFTTAKIEFTVNVPSINTDNEQRDNHLRSDDFFNAEKYPTIFFKSKEIKKVGDNKFKLIGDLTIRDVTKPVELDVTFYGIVKDPWGNTRAGFKITGELNRFDYNLKWSGVLETGGLVAGKEVKLDINVELIKKA